jgi:hypothetical protein
MATKLRFVFFTFQLFSIIVFGLPLDQEILEAGASVESDVLGIRYE